MRQMNDHRSASGQVEEGERFSAQSLPLALRHLEREIMPPPVASFSGLLERVCDRPIVVVAR
jgi:hypothetical protein